MIIRKAYVGRMAIQIGHKKRAKGGAILLEHSIPQETGLSGFHERLKAFVPKKKSKNIQFSLSN